MKRKPIILLVLAFFSFTVYAKSPSTSVGRHGMVVSAQHLATQVGVSILKRGGNAVDAAVAMGYALAVVEPCCGNIGGGGFMMVYLADGTQTVINFREKAPAGLKPGFLEKNIKEPNYAVVGVPGTVKGLNTALNRYGTMPLMQLIQPAIHLAEKGFILQQQDVQFLKLETDAFSQQPNVAQIFLKDHRPYQVGERLIQKKLGETLRLIGEQGEYAFYRGAIADALVKASQENGGLITHSDLANYKITFEKPIACHYRGYQVITTPPPSTGGVVLCELLNIMEGFPLKTYGYGSLETLATNLEAIKYVYQDKGRYLGDPAFRSHPVQSLISGSHAESVRKKIKAQLFNHQYEPTTSQDTGDAFNTTAYLVADAKGNRVAVTYTLNGAFGARVIAGQTGFFLNSELKDFIYGKQVGPFLKQLGSNPDAPAANKRPASFIAQVFMFDHQTPFLMLASPGGDTIPTQILTTIENFVDYKMGLQASIDAPRYHFRWQKGTAHLEPEWVAQGKKALLESVGYKIGKGSGTDLGLPYWGAMAAIYMDARKGIFEGAIDKRRPSGMAKGY